MRAKVKAPEANLVQQPLHRTLEATINNELKEEIERSVVGITEEIEWADMLQERLNCLEFYGMKVRGISHKFLLTFQEKEDISNANMDELLKIFKSIKEVTYLDLVVPRIAWVCCDGLPIIVVV